EGSTATDATATSLADDATTAAPATIGPVMTAAWSGVRTDGSDLVIVFLGNPATSAAPGGCRSDYQAVATETDQAVTVTVHGTRVDPCPDQIQYGRSVRVALAAPLGDREVLDGAGGAPAEVFDGARLLHPTWLPDGWEQILDHPAVFGTGSPVAGWQLGWGPPSGQGTSCGADVSPVDLTVGTADQLLSQSWVTSFATVGTTTVGGHPAEQARYQPAQDPNAATETMIRWSDGNEGYVLRSAPSCPLTEQPAGFDLLQRLADGLS
ncbi:MAG: hypothetical protein ACXWA3_10175, partial [Acidimicrobiales bacterium]